MQSRLLSLVEAITNVVVGYAVAVLTQLMVFPVFGLKAAFGEHLAEGFVFVGISLIRSYLLRRLFEMVRVGETTAAGRWLRRRRGIGQVSSEAGADIGHDRSHSWIR